jgi:hypothetical protein
MWESGADAATVEIDHATVLATGEDDAPAKGVAALMADQTRPQQQVQGIAQMDQMTSQIAAGSISEPQFFEEGRIIEAALPQILNGLGVAVQLRLVKGSGSVEQLGLGSDREVLLQVGDGFPEGEMLRKLHQAN